MIEAVFDVVARSFDLRVGDLSSHHCDLIARIEGAAGGDLRIRDISYGAQAHIGGVEVWSVSMPPDGVKFVQTDQDILSVHRFEWESGDLVEISAWLNLGGLSMSSTTTVTAPQPVERDLPEIKVPQL